MKTYKKVIESPRLVIEYDNDAESPRKNQDNLGYFYTKDSNYHSPDGNDSDIYQIMLDTGDEADNLKDYLKRMKKRINAETDEKVLAIYPVMKYEHGSVYYRLGEAHGFDYSNNGFYIITDKTQKIVGTPKSRFEKVIMQELEEYNQWANEEIYSFVLYNDKGEIEDSLGGLYAIEDIRENLPDDWKKEDLQEYLK